VLIELRGRLIPLACFQSFLKNRHNVLNLISW